MAGSSKSRNRLSTCLRVLLSLRKVPARKAGTLIRIRSHSVSFPLGETGGK